MGWGILWCWCLIPWIGLAAPAISGERLALKPVEAPLIPGKVTQLTAYVVDNNGHPLVGRPMKAACPGVAGVTVVETTPGVYQVNVDVAEVPLQPWVELTLEVGAAHLTTALPVTPGHPPQVQIQAASERLLLGKEQRQVQFTLDTALPGWPVPRVEEIRTYTSVGQLTVTSVLPDGRVMATYDAPEGQAPRVALVAAVISSGPWLRWGWSTLTLVGRRSVEVDTEPGSTTWADVGGATFGPVRADATGKATFALDVPPGVTAAVIRARTPTGGNVRSTLPLGAPTFPRGLLVPLVSRITTEMGAPFLTLGIESDGLPLPPALLSAVSSQPLGRNLLLEAPGVVLSTLVTTTADVTAPLTLSLDSALGALPLELKWRAGRPQTLHVEVAGGSVRVDEPPAPVQVTVLDGAGRPSAGGKVELRVEQGQASTPALVGTGHFVAAFTPPASLAEVPVGEGGLRQLNIEARLNLEQGSPGEGRLYTWPPRTLVDVEKWTDDIPIPLRLLDDQGLPVSGVDLMGEVKGVAASVAGSSTDERGWGSIRVRPEPGVTGPAVVEIWPAGQPVASVYVLLLFSRGGDEGFELPREARPTDADLVSSTRVVVREGRVREVQVSAQPSLLFVDGTETAQVRVRFLDGRGNVVIPEGLEATASTGSLGEWSPDGDGLLTVYTPPTEVGEGRARVTVKGLDGEFAGGTDILLERHLGNLMWGIHGGIMTNFGVQTFPAASTSVQWAIPHTSRHVYLRSDVAYGFFQLDSTAEPATSGESTQLHQRYSMWLGDLGLCFRTTVGHFSVYAGGSYALARIHIDSNFDGSDEIQNTQYADGFRPIVGVERSLGGAGLGFELGHVDGTMKNVDGSLAGDIGGFSAAITYNIYLF